jgi:four helix bundle protein
MVIFRDNNIIAQGGTLPITTHESSERQRVVISNNHLEGLIAWQKARDLSAAITTTAQESRGSSDLALAEQMQRTAASLISGIESSVNQSCLPDFYHFLVIAKASCSEVRSQLHMALDIGFIDQAQFNNLLAQVTEVAQMLNEVRASQCGIGAANLPQPHPG